MRHSRVEQPAVATDILDKPDYGYHNNREGRLETPKDVNVCAVSMFVCVEAMLANIVRYIAEVLLTRFRFSRRLFVCLLCPSE